MNVNVRALDAALNIVGEQLDLPLNNIVFSIHNAVDAAEQRGWQDGFQKGFENGFDLADNEDEVEQVAEEVYDDGYLDAVHDFELSPAGARQQANEIWEERQLAAANRAFDPEVVTLNLFPVDAEDLQ